MYTEVINQPIAAYCKDQNFYHRAIGFSTGGPDRFSLGSTEMLIDAPRVRAWNTTATRRRVKKPRSNEFIRYLGVWPFWVALLAAPKLEQFTKHQKITGRDEGFIPAPLLSASLSESRAGRAGINPSS